MLKDSVKGKVEKKRQIKKVPTLFLKMTTFSRKVAVQRDTIFLICLQLCCKNNAQKNLSEEIRFCCVKENGW